MPLDEALRPAKPWTPTRPRASGASPPRSGTPSSLRSSRGEQFSGSPCRRRNDGSGGVDQLSSSAREGPIRSWSRSTVGASLVSFATVTELRDGAINGDWGELRRQSLERNLRTFIVVQPNDRLMSTVAECRSPCEHHAYEGPIHAFVQFAPMMSIGQRAADEACAALRTALSPRRDRHPTTARRGTTRSPWAPRRYGKGRSVPSQALRRAFPCRSTRGRYTKVGGSTARIS